MIGPIGWGRDRTALFAVNFFMADMSAGMGPFLSVLLQSRGWSTVAIGTVLTGRWAKNMTDNRDKSRAGLPVRQCRHAKVSLVTSAGIGIPRDVCRLVHYAFDCVCWRQSQR